MKIFITFIEIFRSKLEALQKIKPANQHKHWLCGLFLSTRTQLTLSFLCTTDCVLPSFLCLAFMGIHPVHTVLLFFITKTLPNMDNITTISICLTTSGNGALLYACQIFEGHQYTFWLPQK